MRNESRTTSFRGLVATAIGACMLLAFLPGVPTAQALGSSCSFSGDYGRCTFVCAPGDHIHVSAYDTFQTPGHYPRTHATCGTVDGYCQAHLSCQKDLGATATPGIGTCYSETIQNNGGCWTTAG